MANIADITPELLRQLICFDESSGKYFWCERPEHMFPKKCYCTVWNKGNAGFETMVYIDNRGYRKIYILGIPILAHRAVWAYHYGEWPKGQIDHINGVRSDNRLQNLRDVTQRENGRNQRLHSNNTTGISGICWDKKNRNWTVRIKHNGKRIWLGSFREMPDAIFARKAAEKKFGYHPNHGGQA